MTPGTYIRLRRERDGLSIEDLALQIGSVPADKHIERVRWLGIIESDVLPVSPATALVLGEVLSIDPYVLGQLVEAQAHRPADIPQICRACGCTDDHACPQGCAWVEPDLCSVCAREADALPVAPMLLGQGGEAAA